MIDEIKDDFDDMKISDSINGYNSNINNTDSSLDITTPKKTECIEKESPEKETEKEKGSKSTGSSRKRRRRKRSNNKNKTNINSNSDTPLKQLSYAEIAKRKIGANDISDEEKAGVGVDVVDLEQDKKQLSCNLFGNNKSIVTQDTFDQSNYYARKSSSHRNKKVLKQQKLKEKFLTKRYS